MQRPPQFVHFGERQHLGGGTTSTRLSVTGWAHFGPGDGGRPRPMIGAELRGQAYDAGPTCLLKANKRGSERGDFRLTRLLLRRFRCDSREMADTSTPLHTPNEVLHNQDRGRPLSVPFLLPSGIKRISGSYQNVAPPHPTTYPYKAPGEHSSFWDIFRNHARSPPPKQRLPTLFPRTWDALQTEDPALPPPPQRRRLREHGGLRRLPRHGPLQQPAVQIRARMPSPR